MSLPKGKDSLVHKLRAVAEELEKTNKISPALRKAVDRVANSGPTVLSASTFSFNQYVHNFYTFAKPQELYASWDEMKPFLEKLT